MTQSPTAIIGQTQLFREGIQVLLRRSRFVVTVNTMTISAALSGFVIKKPELAICAIPINEDPIEWIGELLAHCSEFLNVRIVFLTDYITQEILRQATMAGVNAVLSYNITGEVLQRSLELVALGQQLFPSVPNAVIMQPPGALVPFRQNALPNPSGIHQEVRALAIKPSLGFTTEETGSERVSALSNRERQILHRLVEGAANKTIARDLEITEATVKVHIKGLLRKINVSNRTQAAVWGLNNKAFLEEPRSALREPMSRTSFNGHAAS